MLAILWSNLNRFYFEIFWGHPSLSQGLLLMSLSPVNLNLFHFLHSIGFSGLRKFVMKEKWDSVIIKDDHVVKYICFIFLGFFFWYCLFCSMASVTGFSNGKSQIPILFLWKEGFVAPSVMLKTPWFPAKCLCLLIFINKYA